MKGIFNITIGTQNATKILAIISEAGKMNSCRILRKGHKLYWSPSMTPERAAELAKAICILRMDDVPFAFIGQIEDLILAACKEDQDQDARIMDEAADDVAEWGAYAPAYFQDKWNLRKTIQKWKDRAKAIRSAE